MLDVGSTTADVIPIAAGRVAAEGRTDLDRLLAGELVYTGALRTNLAAIAPRVPVRGRWCPVASELFAISADVHLILGHLAPEAYTCPTPDGRAASVECARERVARLVCADVEQLEPAEIEAIAAYLHAEQVRQIEAAARQVSTRIAGARRSCRSGSARSSPARWRSASAAPCSSCRGARQQRDAAPAAALADLAAAVCARRADRRQGRRRARAGGRRRRAAGAVHRDRGGGRAPSAARRAGRRGVRGRGPRARPTASACGRRPRTGWRSWRWTSSAGRSPTSSRVRRAAWTSGRRATVSSRSCCRRRCWRSATRSPQSWAVTSDSIAAWVAGAAGAERLVLLKPVAGLYRTWPPAGEPIARLTVDELAALAPAGVDEHLPAALRAAGVETWVIDGREPARLAELLDDGPHGRDARGCPANVNGGWVGVGCEGGAAARFGQRNVGVCGVESDYSRLNVAHDRRPTSAPQRRPTVVRRAALRHPSMRSSSRS